MLKADATLPTPPSPGDVLRDHYLAGRGVTQDQLAAALGVSRFSVNQILNGRRNITAEMALRLARVLNTTPQFWLNLQQALDLHRVHLCKAAEIDVLSPLAPRRDGGPPLTALDALFHRSDDGGVL